MIESNCENVRIWPKFFKAETYSDFFWVWKRMTRDGKINQTMTNNSTIIFKSNGSQRSNSKGFKLIWNCENNNYSYFNY